MPIKQQLPIVLESYTLPYVWCICFLTAFLWYDCTTSCKCGHTVAAFASKFKGFFLPSLITRIWLKAGAMPFSFSSLQFVLTSQATFQCLMCIFYELLGRSRIFSLSAPTASQFHCGATAHQPFPRSVIIYQPTKQNHRFHTPPHPNCYCSHREEGKKERQHCFFFCFSSFDVAVTNRELNEGAAELFGCLVLFIQHRCFFITSICFRSLMSISSVLVVYRLRLFSIPQLGSVWWRYNSVDTHTRTCYSSCSASCLKTFTYFKDWIMTHKTTYSHEWPGHGTRKIIVPLFLQRRADILFIRAEHLRKRKEKTL